jgi:hypothetical protein
MTLSSPISGSDLLAIRFSTNPSDGVPDEYKEIVDEIKQRSYDSGHDDGWNEACEIHCVDDISDLEFELDTAQSKQIDRIEELKEIYKRLCNGEIETAKESIRRRLSDEGEL